MPRKAEVPTLFQYQNEPKSLFISQFNHNPGSIRSIKPTPQGCIVNLDYCLAPDTMVELINNERDTIKSICERVTSGEDLYTYSINPDTEEIEVSKIVAGRQTRKNEPTLKITLDNGETIVSSYNHKFLLRNGKYVPAEELDVNTSLMSFSKSEIKSYYGVSYRYIGVNKNLVNCEPEHILIYKYFHEDYVPSVPIHHEDENGLNNSLDNLTQLSSSEHFSEHVKRFWDSIPKEQRGEWIKSHWTEETTKIISENTKKQWKNMTKEEYEEMCKKIADSIPDRSGENNGMYGKGHSSLTRELISERQKEYNKSLTDEQRKAKSVLMTRGNAYKVLRVLQDRGLEVTKDNYEKVRREITKRGIKWETACKFFLEDGIITNHKIISIEPYEPMDLYDIEVEKYHNFALTAGVFVHNSQLELRIAGVISGDKVLEEVYKSGIDLHIATASKTFGIPIEEVTKDARTKAKGVGFGIIYGKSGATFGKELYLADLFKEAGDVKGDGKSLPEKTQQKIRRKATELGYKIVEDYLNAYPGLSQWLKDTQEFAMEHGYVETMFGRRRRLPDLYSTVDSIREGALRQAINAPIQGTGSDFTLRSIIEINDFLRKNGFKSRMSGTVHDSIVFDIYLPEFREVVLQAKYIMEHVHEKYIDTGVPILSEIEAGDSYGGVFEMDAEEVDKILTPSDFYDWLHDQKIKKYTKEIKFFHDNAKMSKDDAIAWMVRNNRPIKELKSVLEETYV